MSRTGTVLSKPERQGEPYHFVIPEFQIQLYAPSISDPPMLLIAVHCSSNSLRLHSALPTSCGCLVEPKPTFDSESKSNWSPENFKSDRDDERRLVEADLGRERVVRGPCAAGRRRLLG